MTAEVISAAEIDLQEARYLAVMKPDETALIEEAINFDRKTKRIAKRGKLEVVSYVVNEKMYRILMKATDYREYFTEILRIFGVRVRFDFSSNAPLIKAELKKEVK